MSKSKFGLDNFLEEDSENFRWKLTLSGLTPYQILALIHGSMKLNFLPVSKKFHHLMEDPITKMNTNKKRSAFSPKKGNFHHPHHTSRFVPSLSLQNIIIPWVCVSVWQAAATKWENFLTLPVITCLCPHAWRARRGARSLDIYIKVIWASNCSTVWPLGSMLATNDRCK
jgi:hypothetical protein